MDLTIRRIEAIERDKFVGGREGVPNSRETNEVKITYSVFGGKTWHNLFDVEDVLLEQLNLRKERNLKF